MMMPKEIEKERNAKVRKGNLLVRQGRYKLTVSAQKLLSYLISKIPFEATEFPTIELSIGEFLDVAGISDSGKNYQMVKDALSDLLSKTARVWVPVSENEQRKTPLVWIMPPEVDEVTGRSYIKLNEKLRKYLLDLKSNYTQISLGYMMKFESKYSFRLFELISSYQYSKEISFKKSFPLDELRELLDADDYKKFCDLNARVIKPSVKEINKYTNKNIEVNTIKQGRRVASLEFTISSKTGSALDTVRQAAGLPAQPVQDKPQPKRSARVPAPQRPEYRIEQTGDALTPERVDKLASMRKLYGHIQSDAM